MALAVYVGNNACSGGGKARYYFEKCIAESKRMATEHKWYHKFEFTIASKNSGIEGVADEAEAQPVAVELYTVDGRQISKADAEGRGIVIVRSIYADGSSTVKKEVR